MPEDTPAIPDSTLALSDEAFLEQDNSAYLTDEVIPNNEEVTNKETDSADQTADDAEDKNDSEAQEQTETEADGDKVSQPEGDTQTEHETSTDDDATESLDTSKKDSPDTKGDTPDTKEFDYESAYKKVTEPFKANGIDMQVKDPEDMIRLMQMGANYQKKMAQLKPNLKIVSMLEKNGLLDEAKLNNLIDLSKKDLKAITKLIKESDLDPLDIDKDAPSDYKPTNYSVTDKEYNLDTVLNDIKDTPTFDKTINVLTKQWDDNSKTAISDNPEIIEIINGHMGNGVFDAVNKVLQQEKALGKLVGISDVDAYQQIAQNLSKSGVLRNNGNSKGKKEESAVSSETTEKSQAAAEALNKKRKAVAPVKQTTAKKSVSDDNYLALSDEEFMKKFAVR